MQVLLKSIHLLATSRRRVHRVSWVHDLILHAFTICDESGLKRPQMQEFNLGTLTTLLMSSNRSELKAAIRKF